MSSTDDRVVKMEFDNAQFKKGAAETQKSLADVNKAVDASGKSKGLLDLSSHMQQVSVTASRMAVVTTAALATIATKATNVALRMASSLTLDPLKQGFAEYESLLTKQNVIMNATGASGKRVKKVLNELNTYSDQTIYSFGNMTDAVQKFVNAGVPLGQSVTSIKGIANAAAFAGASSEEANRAMYAFSQSMSLGFIQLQDWNQIENANMGTIKFKNELLKAGVAAGTLTKRGNEFITKSGKAITATKGWRDGLQEQWATTDVLNTALGKYADNTTTLGKKAFKSAQEVRTFSAFMDTLKESIGSGWAGLFYTLSGGLQQSTKFWTGLSNAVGNSVGKFFAFSEATLKTFKTLGGMQKIGQILSNVFAPLSAVFNTVRDAWAQVFPSKGPGSGEALYKVVSFIEMLTQPLVSLSKWIPKLTSFLVVFFTIFKMGAESVSSLVGYLSDLTEQLTETMNLKLPGASGLEKFVDGVKTALGKLLDVGIEAGKALLEGIADAFSSGNIDTVANAATAGLLGSIYVAFKKFTSSGIDLTGGFLKSVSGAFDTLTDSLGAMQAQLKSKTLMQIALAVSLLAASMVALSFIDGKKLATALGAIAAGFGQLLLAMAILTKIGGSGAFITLPLLAAGMVLLAGSILILSGAIAIMSALSWEQIAKGLSGVAGALVAIALGMKLMPATLPITAAGLMLVSFSLIAISGAMAAMSLLSWEDIGKGLATTAGALIAIALAMKLMPISLPVTAAGLVLVAGALNGIALALKIMGSMSWDEIGRGLVVLGGSLLILAAGLNLMSGTLFGSAALLVAALAIDVLTPALIAFSKLSYEEIGKSMVALAGGLLILAGGLYLMSGAIPGALALLIVAPAIVVLATALTMLSLLSWEQILTGLAALAGLFLTLGVAGLLLGPLVPVLLGLGAAILLIGASMALAGAGTLAFATGLGILIGIGAAGIALVTGVIDSLIGKLADLGAGIGDMLAALASSLASNAPIFGAAFVDLVTTLIDAGRKLLPKLAPLFVEALTLALKVIEKMTPRFVSTGIKLIIGFINALANNIDRIADVAGDLIVNFIGAIGKQQAKIANAGADAIIDFINAMADSIRTKGPELGEAMGNLGTAMVEGLIGGIGAMFGEAVGKIGELAEGMVGKAKSILKIFSPSRVFNDIGTFLVQGLTNGIQNNAVSAITAVASMVGGQIAVANEYISDFIQKLDQQAIAARAKADGLAAAAERAQKAADKTKTKADDKAANRLTRRANKADKEAARKEAQAEQEKAKQDRADKFNSASYLEKAQMRSEDAQDQLDAAKAAEARAAKARAEANALDRQAKAKGVTKKQRKEFEKRADELRKQAAADAQAANNQIEAAKKSAADALAYQKLAGDEAAAAFQKAFESEAKQAADDAAFGKLTDAEKAEIRRKQAADMQKKADEDLAKAKKLAYTDLEAANALAVQAMDEAEQARQYLTDAQSFADNAAKGTTTSTTVGNGSVVNLSPTEAAAIGMINYDDLYSSGLAAAAGGNKVEFNQYNSSPEPLNPVEVYRRTNNQLSFAEDKLSEMSNAA